MDFLKKPDDVLTAALFNGLQLLCRLGAVGKEDRGLVRLEEPVGGNSLRGTYLFARAGLTEFDVHVEETVARPASPVPGEAWSLELVEGAAPWPERLRFQALTAQPLLACDPSWLPKRLESRHEEIDRLGLADKVGGSLQESLTEVGRLSSQCPELLSYRELRRVWKACLWGLRLVGKGKPPEPLLAHGSNSRDEFRALEEELARRVWTDKDFDEAWREWVSDRYQRHPTLGLRIRKQSGKPDRLYAVSDPLTNPGAAHQS